MKDNIFVLCDQDEEYAGLMTEYIRKNKNLPWELHTYTSVVELMRAESGKQITILAVSESTFSEDLDSLHPKNTVILWENGVLKEKKYHHVDKYQEAEKVLKEFLEVYMEFEDDGKTLFQTEGGTKLIGIYSPVRRCLQTTFALTLSELLAREHTTLYINFEHYAGITELYPEIQTRDLADLLYFLTAQKDKFRMRLRTIIQKKGLLDYIPPMKSGQNLLTIPASEWLNLLVRIEEFGEYEYVILDLSESMQGLFEILRACKKVFTLTRDDRISAGKILQYEQVLSMYSFEDVIKKTQKLSIPHFQRLPIDLEQYTRGELAEYVGSIVRELEA